MLTLKMAFKIKKNIAQLLFFFLVGNLLSGCATVGANLALKLAKDEEAKGCVASDPGESVRKVNLEDCERISRLIKKAGVAGGFVGYDKSGRLKLKGSYQNENELDLAYMTALTVVGTSSMEISKVTPRDLQEIRLVKSYVPQQISGKNGDKYALLVGVSEFKYPRSQRNPLGITPIESAVKDVESIEDALKKNGFKKENITSLKNEQATKSNILNAMREFEGKVTPSDSVVVYISTHGTPPNTFGKMGILPYDMKVEILDKSATESVQDIVKNIANDDTGDNEIIGIVKKRVASLKTAVSFDNIQDFITSIKTDKLVAILDTCYSGSALGALSYPVGGTQYVQREQNYSQSLNVENKSELVGSGKICKIDQKSSYGSTVLAGIKTQQQKREQTQCESKTKKSSGSKGLSVEPSTEDTLTQMEKMSPVVKKPSDYNYDDMENLRAAFGTTTQPRHGKVILTATSNNEESLFDPSIFDNSYFTHYLLKGLQNSNGQILPAFDYAQVRTRKLVDATEKCRTQTPEMISAPDECINVDLSK